MLKKIFNLVKQSSIYGLGTIAVRAVSFILFPFYSHWMVPSEYAIMTLFLIMIGLLQPIYMHGLDIAYLRFSANAERDQQRRDLGTVLVHALGFGILLSIPLLILAPQIAALVVKGSGAKEIAMTRISIAIVLLDTLSFHISTFLRIRNKAILFSLVKLGHVFLNIALNFLFVGYLHNGALGVFQSFLWSSVGLLAVLLFAARKEIHPGWSWMQIREWLIFGLPNVPSMIFYIFVEFSDRKLIELMMDKDSVGIYSAGYKIGMLMNMVAQAFRFAWQPFFLQTADDDDARETFARVLTYFIAFAGMLWLLATFFLEDILTIRLPKYGAIIDIQYWDCMKVFPIIMLAHIFNGIYANFMVGIFLKKKTIMIPLIIGIAAAVNVVGNLLLIPKYGYLASAWLTVLAYFLMAALTFLYINPKYPVPYEWRRIGRLALTLAAVWGVASVFSEYGAIWVKLFLTCGLICLWWFYVLMEDERLGIRRRLRK